MGMVMVMDARDIADYLLAKIDTEAGDSITNLKLQKVLYYAQGWALAVLGKPLFDEEVEAWKYGPVVPSIYHAFKKFGDGAIMPNEDAKGLLPTDIATLIDQVWNRYGDMSGLALMRQTHREAPWHDAYDPDAASKPIAKADMQAFFVREQERLAAQGGLAPPDDETLSMVEAAIARHG